MLRSFLAILGGFLSMALLVGIATAIAVRLMLPPASNSSTMPRPTTPYLAVNLAYSGLAALLGGVIAALLAGRAPLAHSVTLGTIVLALSLFSMRFYAGQQPRWYQITIAASMPLFVVLGGLLSSILRRKP